MKIRFCKNSPKGKNRLAKRLVEEFPGADVKVKGCCKQCKICRTSPCCVVDHERLVTAVSWDELYLTLRELIVI